MVDEVIRQAAKVDHTRRTWNIVLMHDSGGDRSADRRGIAEDYRRIRHVDINSRRSAILPI